MKKQSDKVLEEHTYQKVYPYSIDDVWRAAQLALKYPIAVNNIDNGILETDYIAATDGLILPWQDRDPKTSVRYKINLSIVKGKIEGKDSVRVTVNKRIERVRDFFSKTETVDTDGYEERMILYRIDRELVIAQALKKVK